MCRAILEGLRNHLDQQGRYRRGARATLPVEALAEEDLWESLRAKVLALSSQGNSQLGDIVDATTGQLLRGELVRSARQLEMKYFEDKKVYDKVPTKQCYDITGTGPITTRWVDINKGDALSPNYRSRLVARGLNTSNDRP